MVQSTVAQHGMAHVLSIVTTPRQLSCLSHVENRGTTREEERGPLGIVLAVETKANRSPSTVGETRRAVFPA